MNVFKTGNDIWCLYFIVSSTAGFFGALRPALLVLSLVMCEHCSNYKEWWCEALSGDELSLNEKALIRVDKKGIWQGRALLIKLTAVEVYRAVVEEVGL